MTDETCSACGAALVNEDCPNYGYGVEHAPVNTSPITGGTWWIHVTRIPITEDGDTIGGLDPLANYAFGPFASEAEAVEEMESDSGQIYIWCTEKGNDWMVDDVFVRPDLVDEAYGVEPEIFYPQNGESTYIHAGSSHMRGTEPGKPYGWWCRCGAASTDSFGTVELARHDGDKHLELANNQPPAPTAGPFSLFKEARSS